MVSALTKYLFKSSSSKHGNTTALLTSTTEGSKVWFSLEILSLVLCKPILFSNGHTGNIVCIKAWIFCESIRMWTPNSQFVVVISLLSRIQLFETPWTAACQASLSLSPRVCSNSYPLSWWCYPAISSSVALFSSCFHSFAVSWYSPKSWLFARGGQNIGASARHQSFQWLFSVDFL